MDNQLSSIKKILVTIHPNKDLDLARLKMYSATVSIILSKELFPKNYDIKLFLDDNQIIFKEYVFKSRTLLLSRIIRVVEKMDSRDLENLLSEFNKLLKTNMPKSKASEKESLSKSNPVDDLLNRFGRS